MSREVFKEWLEEHKDALGDWNVGVEERRMSNLTVGCFYDEDLGTWVVYRNDGNNSVRLQISDEEKAFSKLRAMVKYIIWNNRGTF